MDASNMGDRKPLLSGRPAVINVGLDLFYRSVQEQGAEVAQVDWRPPAGGNAKMAGLLDRLSQGRKPRS